MTSNNSGQDVWLPAIALMGDIDGAPGVDLRATLEGWGLTVSKHPRTVDGWCRGAVVCVRMSDEPSDRLLHVMKLLHDIAVQEHRVGAWPFRIVIVRIVGSDQRYRAIFAGGNRPASGVASSFTAKGWEILSRRADGDSEWAGRRLDEIVRTAMWAESTTSRDLVRAVLKADREGGRFSQLVEVPNVTGWHGVEGVQHAVTSYLVGPP